MDSKLIWGTIQMLILEVMSRGSSYGYQITQTVLELSRGRFELKEGSLYPALHRMEREGWLSSYWVESDEGRRRRYYKITAAGRKVLNARRREWTEFVEGVEGIMGAARGLA